MKKQLLISLLALLSYSGMGQNPYRGVLLEYFMGHTCANCPRADRMADSLKTRFGDSIALVNIHSGSFAQQQPFPFNDDLTCPTCEAIDTFFQAGANGIPTGMVSRINYSAVNFTHLIFYLNWFPPVLSVLQQTPLALVDHTNNYNSTTHVLNTTVYTQALANLNGNYYLSVFLTEDSIISAMEDVDAPNFIDTFHVNNNLLRAGINGTWGTLINSGPIPSGTTITNSFNYTLSTSWVPSHCKVVCFVYDNATKEVLQISQKALLDNSPSPLSINELSIDNSIEIYPNPFSSQTTITFSEEHTSTSSVLHSILITDVLGNTILQSTINNHKSETIDMNGFAKGIYFVRITDEKKNVVNRKIVVQ